MLDRSTPRLPGKPVVLASGSRTRHDLLTDAGLHVEAVSSGLDEGAVIAAIAADRDPLPPADVASILAEAKAQTVSEQRSGAIVIGADQTLELDGKLFTKPDSVDVARRNLLAMRGKTHLLHSAVAIVLEGATVWTHSASAALTMRDFTPEFLGRYSAAAGETLLDSVGCYQIEGLGIQLFDKIDGDWFTILGLPMLPLLARLREMGVVET